jgi:glycolate oxidase iron-sulfur subunit
MSNSNLISVLPSDDVLSQCIHCGMCLASCPTYELTKFERSSPRGRIKLIKSVARGEMEISATFADEMSFCLDCQACETACPAGVKYGSMVEAARVEVDKAGYGSFIGRFIKRISLEKIVARKKYLRIAARFLYMYQSWGLQSFLHKSGLFKLISPGLAEIDKLAPRVSKIFSEDLIPEVVNSNGKEKFKIAFLTGCLMDVMFAEINVDTVDLLKKLGCTIYSPREQGCCGSLHAHNGDFQTAIELAKHNLKVFSKYDFDFLISNSAGCGAYMKEYAHLFEDDPEYSGIAKEFSRRVKDISEFLSENNIQFPKSAGDKRVTYHDACHLVHSQKIFNQPRKVLTSLKNIDYSELEESTWCCGSAGIYNIVRYDDSMKILERKMQNIKEGNASICLTGNPGCISQIKYGALKFNVDVEVMHPVTYLNKLID